MKKAMVFCAAGALLASLATSAIADGSKKDTRLQRQQAKAKKRARNVARKQARNEQQQQGPQLQLVPANLTPIYVQPKRIAKILGIDENGKTIYGEWVPYTGNQTDNPNFPPIAWDMFEGDWNDPGVCDGDEFQHFMANGPLSGGFGSACDFGAGFDGSCGSGDTTRWWFGDSTFFSGYLEKLEEFASTFGCTDALVSFVPFTWSQILGDGDIARCGNYLIGTTIIQILTYDTDMGDLFDGSPYTRADLDAAVLGGVALDFGFIPGTNLGYYWTNADLRGSGFEFPAVEGGLLEVQFINTDDFEENPVPATGMMGMLWGAKDVPLQGNRNFVVYMDGADQNCDTYDQEYNTGAGGEAFDMTGAVGCPTNFVGMMMGLHADPDCGGGGGCATSGTIVKGNPVNDDITAACGSDDTYWSARSETLASTFTGDVHLEASGNVGTGGIASLDLSVETMVTVNTVIERCFYWNYISSTWDLAGSRNINQTDAVNVYSAPGTAQDYVDTNGDVKVRFVYIWGFSDDAIGNVSIDDMFWTAN